MGFLKRDKWVAQRYVMREKFFDIGDDFWVENDQGERVFKVNGKAIKIRDQFVLENASGRELYQIEERKLFRDKLAIERDGNTVARVKKALVSPFSEKYHVDIEDGEDLTVKGDIIGHEYEIEGDGKVAEISKKWFKMRDTYGIEIADGVDHALIIAIAVCVEKLAEGDEEVRD
jgi:uncharacterized protein YxjI